MEVTALSPEEFRAALIRVPPARRDAWLDAQLGLGELPDDGALPPGCVPYLPCPVDAILRAVEHAGVTAADVFVDLGAGVGRVTALVHLLTGASTIGVEIQPALVRASRALAAPLRYAPVEGDAVELAGSLTTGTVFFLYCPFGGARLDRVLDELEAIARTREIRVCAVDLPLPARAWLARCSPDGDVEVYRSAR